MARLASGAHTLEEPSRPKKEMKLVFYRTFLWLRLEFGESIFRK
jgi:hypothetical protein